MPELKPCPFCGGDATLTGCFGEYRVECSNCLATGAPSREIGNWDDRQQEAIELWNRRDG